VATANLKIDQAGLSPAGVAGKARLDGKPDGSLVTLTSTVPGAANTFRLLFVPPGDDEALDSLTPVGSGATPVWTFSPKAGIFGPYLIELTVDGVKQVRVFGIRSWRHNIVAPALNEGGDPTAHSDLSGAALATALARTPRNVDRDGLPSVDGWQRALVDIVNELDVGNYSQMVVPANARCVVPAGQRMFFRGTLSGDYQGDFEEIGPETPPLAAGQVLGKAANAHDDGTLQALRGSQLRHLLFQEYPGGSSVDIVNQSGGGTAKLEGGVTVNDWGASSEPWRAGYVFEIFSNAIGTFPCTITGFAHDEIAEAESFNSPYARPPGPRFSFFKFLRLNPGGCGLVLKHNDNGSAIGNRIFTPAGEDFYVAPGSSFALVYNDSQPPGHWIVISIPQSLPWSDVYSNAGTWPMRAGSYTRFRNDNVDGVILETPSAPLPDGVEVSLKEVSGNGGFLVTITANGSSIEALNGVIDFTATIPNDARGVFIRYKYDGQFNVWRLVDYMKPEGIA
jgi:hypothetical protein